MRDIAELLDPIPGDDPAGADLRYDAVYDRIKELRREDDPNAARGIWTTKLKVADWAGVIETAYDALAHRTKDLQIAAWMVEGLAARNGLLGAAAGLDLLRALTERFWDRLWPRPDDDDDMDARLAPLVWIDARLGERMMLTQIADDGDPAPPSWHDYVSAQRGALAARTAKRKAKDAENPEAELERLMGYVAATGGAHFERLHGEIRIVVTALAGLRAALDTACGGDGPSFSRLTQTLEALEGFVRAECVGRGLDVGAAPTVAARSAVEEALMSEVTADAEAHAHDDASTGFDAPGVPPASVDGVIRSRDDAYRTLIEVARFLERTEPHSPVPHLLRRAIAWGRMSLPELLTELMSDQGNVFNLLGIDPREPARPPGRGR